MSANLEYFSDAATADTASLATESVASTLTVHVKAACQRTVSSASSERCRARAAARYQAKSIGCPARSFKLLGILDQSRSASHS